jgi:hypothetical protein
MQPLHGNLPGKGFPEDFHAGPLGYRIAEKKSHRGARK